MKQLRLAISASLTLCMLGLIQIGFADSETSACAADVKRLCADVKPGNGRIVKCLKEHKLELSGSCKQKAEEIRDDCKDDAEKLCKGAGSGAAPIFSCLRKHEAELSQDCKRALPHGLPPA